ncbi:metalloregulator ArsR/SmtB family transcription factor [Cytobacillus sp. Sa5YUA1]|uniref:Metalloregulator ArsR/SmtB family transcription factor n=1 Tax=Cytobacillus stercorigallinarum TaxID=2762240 RepID=A0ABR8QN27_9BACI|nr:metalloregulator ArsR/SmtB family transcription factor [Cytobacillus stercorigallinarum]MBD7936932.1 metalloregulator ArsR/SmtB family transcription factor [Cytobacillus stercorigallinarum]
MQLNRLVAFHKTMGDPTRIRIVYLLSKGPLHGQAIAGKLGLTPPTITHHLHKLRDINLVYTRREKNTVYYYLNEKIILHQAVTLEKIISQKEELEEMEQDYAYRKKVLDAFIQTDGKLKSIPAQRKKKLIIFEHMVKGLKKGVKYEEKEINEYIKNFHDDFATIRREFITNQYMYRENGIYEVNPPEMWAKIE